MIPSSMLVTHGGRINLLCAADHSKHKLTSHLDEMQDSTTNSIEGSLQVLNLGHKMP